MSQHHGVACRSLCEGLVQDKGMLARLSQLIFGIICILETGLGEQNPERRWTRTLNGEGRK